MTMLNTALTAIVLVCLLQACTAARTSDEVAALEATTDNVPELTLNLPQGKCNCVPLAQTDYTFLERGFDALTEGDYVEAVQSFQRYQRLEKSTEAQLEAETAIAYVSTMTKSPFFDPVEARKANRRLYKQLTPGMEVHPKILLMRESLASFGFMQRNLVKLEVSNATLKQDLVKREEALKRLRELALGQSAAPQ